jgi:hypothetical protein
MTVSMKMTVFLGAALCSPVETDWHLRGACCLHRHGIDDGRSNRL